MTLPQASVSAPDHVPPGLVRDCPLLRRGTSTENPFSSMVAEIHEGPAIFWSPDAFPGGRPAWVVRRYEDLRTIYLDTEHFSNHGLTPFSALIGETWVEIPVELDPPMHGKFRTLLNPLFSPKNMGTLENKMRETTRRLVADLRHKGGCEFMADFAFPFPVRIFLDLLNLPQDETPRFLRWEKSLLHGVDMAQVAGAVRELKAYMLEVIDDRRKNPGDDLISFGVHAQIDGRPLTMDELIGYCFNLFVGGLDTVSSAIGLQFRHLAEHPADQEALRRDPGLIPDAVEELLRAYAPASTFRTCVKEIGVGGVTIKPGDKVAMSPTLAGRDPEVFDRPSEIDFSRKPAHVAFAYGPHLCIGLHLARREMRIAMEEFLAGIPAFGLTPGAVVETSLGGVMQPVALPLVWGTGSK